MTATLRGLGFAVPPAQEQSTLTAAQADAWRLDESERLRWARIVRGSMIERRHVVADLATTMGMSTGERMRAYERAAPALAERAAREALGTAGRSPGEITDCVVVSCTGFVAPGVGAIIAPALGLRPTVRHTQIGFMGCFGGILGLRAAVGAASADPEAQVLVVCVEICSLHLRDDRDPQNLVAAAIFADGAAAAVVDGRDGGGVGTLDLGRTLVIDAARDAMAWRIGDDGFAMTLTREVPAALERELPEFVALGGCAGCAVHPGGPGILDAVERSLAGRGLDPHSLPASRAVLRDYGNMSSGSILFVLDEYLRRGGARPVDLLAFGPGLTLDALRCGPPLAAITR